MADRGRTLTGPQKGIYMQKYLLAIPDNIVPRSTLIKADLFMGTPHRHLQREQY